MNAFKFILILMFRPDKLEPVTYNINPMMMESRDLVLEASNILDRDEEYVLRFVASKVGCSVDFDDWFRTGELPPMMKQWLRQNLHYLRERL